MSTDVMISAQGLSKVFGSFRALDKVSFKVNRGEVVGFLGPNGAGKSTTMRILTCFISPTTGKASVHNHDVFDSPLDVRKNLGYLPQRAPLYSDMSVWEYLRFASEMRGLDDSTFRKRMKTIVEVCGLRQSLGKDIGTLSHGYRQRVGLGQALVHDPPILILDEPTSDLDPNEKAEVIKYIKEIGKNRTILLSTHNLTEVEQACARAIIISRGRVVADGSLDDIRARSGKVRYRLLIDEKNALRGSAPSEDEVYAAISGLSGVASLKDTPTDDRAHGFEIRGKTDADLRAEIYRMCVDKGWIILELVRESQTLESVFQDLTRGDDRAARGLMIDDEDDDDDDDDDDVRASAAGTSSDDEDEEEDDEDDEEDEDDDDDDDSDDDDSDDEDDDEDEDEDDEEDESSKKEEKPASKKKGLGHDSLYNSETRVPFLFQQPACLRSDLPFTTDVGCCVFPT
jgi:ABC-2 type transport system ATP-binding protein